ncbi:MULTISPECIES: hypothetical protein [unclassified Lactococcus]|uniref:hypothetical protein n=1 Tax=unclassified Lactococcus TaxID=2643510 RepID=UPI0011CACD6F|nr:MULTISPECIES: hypothetical protein [unclassified Lactococcus]MQW23259.1 hypothetical protein [Lactococcus sp. dk101]TXK38073.1 hypothetical protein FVP42_06585 [Lactococcus sp. dk310]TXK49752.1 hypothetical protein FVP43_06555 [Lactococcus sp. dk322]
MKFEDFLAIARKSFHEEWKNLTENEVAEYLQSEMEYIKSEYDMYSEMFEHGEINITQFKNSASGATGGCLALMY